MSCLKERVIKSKSRLSIFVSLNANSKKLDTFAKLELKKVKLENLYLLKQAELKSKSIDLAALKWGEQD